MNPVRIAVSVVLLVVQLGAMVYARTGGNRYFNWAPYDMQTNFRIEASVGGRALTGHEILLRYRLPCEGVDKRYFGHLTAILEQVEQRFHRHDPAEIRLRYSVNGGALQEWRWTPAK